MRASLNGRGAAATLVALLSLPLVLATPLLVTHAGASAPAASPAGPSKEAFDPAIARRIEVAEVQRRVAGGEKVVFLDTRGGVQGTMIKDAAHVADDDLETWAKDVKPGTLIVTYCA